MAFRLFSGRQLTLPALALTAFRDIDLSGKFIVRNEPTSVTMSYNYSEDMSNM
jgi:hypothetical protein